jgi:hypothetical protein
MPPRPIRKAQTQLSPLGEADDSQSLPRQRSRSGPAAEEEFDLNVVGSGDDYHDDDSSPGHCERRTRGVPETTRRTTIINDPGTPETDDQGPPDIVYFFGGRVIRETYPVTCKICK